MQYWLKRRSCELAGKVLAVFLKPAPGVVEDHGAAIEEQREDRRPAEAGLAIEDALEESDDARQVRHEEGEPEECD